MIRYQKERIVSNANGSSRSKGMDLPRLLGGMLIQPFRELFTCAVHDVTFRILILLLVVFGLKAKVVDVEIAFHGNIEEEVFMV